MKQRKLTIDRIRALLAEQGLLVGGWVTGMDGTPEIWDVYDTEEVVWKKIDMAEVLEKLDK